MEFRDWLQKVIVYHSGQFVWVPQAVEFAVSEGNKVSIKDVAGKLQVDADELAMGAHQLYMMIHSLLEGEAFKIVLANRDVFEALRRLTRRFDPRSKLAIRGFKSHAASDL